MGRFGLEQPAGCALTNILRTAWLLLSRFDRLLPYFGKPSAPAESLRRAWAFAPLDLCPRRAGCRARHRGPAWRRDDHPRLVGASRHLTEGAAAGHHQPGPGREQPSDLPSIQAQPWPADQPSAAGLLTSRARAALPHRLNHAAVHAA